MSRIPFNHRNMTRMLLVGDATLIPDHVDLEVTEQINKVLPPPINLDFH